MSDKYILDADHNPIPCDDLTAWAQSFKSNRRVAYTEDSGVRVSTVFLGLNHNFGRGEPLLFETMVFGGPLDGEQDRYSTWAEAEVGHAAMCRRVAEGAVAK